MVLSFFQQLRQERRIESNVNTSRQNKIDCFSVNGVCNHGNTAFEALGCQYFYCLCQEARLSLSDADIEREVKKREQEEMRRECIRQKGSQIIDMWDCKCWSLYATDASVKGHHRKFLHKCPLVEKQLSQGKIDGEFSDTFKVTLKYPNICNIYSQTFLGHSKIRSSVGAILVL